MFRYPIQTTPDFSSCLAATEFVASKPALNGYVTDDWQSTLGYAYTNARVTSATSTTIVAGNRIQLVPFNQFSWWNKYQITPVWGAALGVIYFSDSFASSDDTVKLPGFVRFDAALYMKINETWRAQLNVENIFNKGYWASADGNNNISPGLPRTFRVRNLQVLKGPSTDRLRLRRVGASTMSEFEIGHRYGFLEWLKSMVSFVFSFRQASSCCYSSGHREAFMVRLRAANTRCRQTAGFGGLCSPSACCCQPRPWRKTWRDPDPASDVLLTLPRDLSPWGMFMAADIVVKAVMVGLAFASVLTWTIWFAKAIELMRARRNMREAIDSIGCSALLVRCRCNTERARRQRAWS